ncbi:hypothetical protein [Mesorhizobium sp. A556]
MTQFLDWKAGDKVVCVKRIVADVWAGEILPLVGAVYTIREIAVSVTDGQESVGIRLKEVVNAPRQYSNAFAEALWPIQAFRPVQTRKSDISIFTAMLHGAKRSVSA